MKRSVLPILLVSLVAIAMPAFSASLVEIVVGIGADTSRAPWRILAPTSAMTNVDWPIHLLLTLSNVGPAGTAVTVERVTPQGKTIVASTVRWNGPFSIGWGLWFLPVPGTPNEELLGQWKFVIRVEQGETREAAFTISQADRSILSAIAAEAEREPNSFNANYRLGAAASMFGDDGLAVTHLSKASQLSRREVYPHLALGRHYAKRGLKEKAIEEFAFARGLLSGVQDQGLAGWLKQVIEDQLRQLE